jgi:hypothetical protein
MWTGGRQTLLFDVTTLHFLLHTPTLLKCIHLSSSESLSDNTIRGDIVNEICLGNGFIYETTCKFESIQLRRLAFLHTHNAGFACVILVSYCLWKEAFL